MLEHLVLKTEGGNGHYTTGAGVQSYHDYLHLYNGHPHTSLYEAKVLEYLVLKTEGGNGHYTTGAK